MTESFDLLLMDYELDNGKGDVLLKELQIARKPIPAIGVSSHGESNTALLRTGHDRQGYGPTGSVRNLGA